MKHVDSLCYSTRSVGGRPIRARFQWQHATHTLRTESRPYKSCLCQRFMEAFCSGSGVQGLCTMLPDPRRLAGLGPGQVARRQLFPTRDNKPAENVHNRSRGALPVLSGPPWTLPALAWAYPVLAVSGAFKRDCRWPLTSKLDWIRAPAKKGVRNKQRHYIGVATVSFNVHCSSRLGVLPKTLEFWFLGRTSF